MVGLYFKTCSSEISKPWEMILKFLIEIADSYVDTEVLD